MVVDTLGTYDNNISDVDGDDVLLRPDTVELWLLEMGVSSAPRHPEASRIIIGVHVP